MTSEEKEYIISNIKKLFNLEDLDSKEIKNKKDLDILSDIKEELYSSVVWGKKES